RPDIMIGLDHPIKKSEPWTQQSLGCSKPGDFIYIPTPSSNTTAQAPPTVEWPKASATNGSKQLQLRDLRTSVRNIIRSHSDMIGQNSKQDFRSPQFTIARHASPKYVLVLENSKAMNDGKHWNFIRTALKKVLKRDFPGYARVGLVLFNDGAHILHTVEFLRHSRDDIARLIPREFSLSPNRGSCVRCGVIKAIEALQTTGTT
ncbi:Epithelial chloride channel proteinlike, partial [Caligus rogercresseyi]